MTTATARGAPVAAVDGPARSAGGFTEWSALILPRGESGLSGAIVDPATRDDRNNTVVEGFRAGDYLKLRLGGTGTPASFGGLLFDVDLRPRGSLVRPPAGGLPDGCRPGPPPAPRG